MQEMWVRSLGGEDLLEKEMATLFSILAWIISWTEWPGGLQFTGSQRVGDDLVTKQQCYHVPVMVFSWIGPHLVIKLFQPLPSFKLSLWIYNQLWRGKLWVSSVREGEEGNAVRKQRSERLGLLAGGEDLEEAFWAQHGNKLGSHVAEVRRDGHWVPKEPQGLVWVQGKVCEVE